VVGPETSQMLAAWALQNDIPTIEVPLQGTNQTIIVPSSLQGMYGGTRAALNWVKTAYDHGDISKDDALKIIDLLRELVKEVQPKFGDPAMFWDGDHIAWHPSANQTAYVPMEPDLVDILNVLAQQEQFYEADVTPPPVPVSTAGSVSPFLILAGGGLLAYLLLKGNK